EVDAHGPGDARDRAGPRRRHAHGHRHRSRLSPDVRDRHRLRRRGRCARVAALRRLSAGRPAVRDARVRRRRARRPRRHGGRHARQPHRGRRRGGGLVHLRRRLEGSLLLPALHRRPGLSSGRVARPARRRDARRMSRLAPDRWAAVAMFAVAALTPLVVRDAFLLDSVILILLWGALSAAWNVAGGYAGQVYLERSRVGYQLAGVREDEDAAEALGIATRRRKVQAIVLSAAMTSACGSLWAQYVGFVDPSHVFSIDLSVRFALNSIIGGIG